ncbi:TetR/AcrR family transcriptional regulator [Promicromonospora sp. NPDC059942]|uniref:TetR/AcrR family transcriptional regulator n=1 Tax=Promicromonospora sp. NPDC059942 TaxID=3347009 RepID=UPI003657F334
MISREQWIDEGLVVLSEQGTTGLRIDRIAGRLRLTKGSFHHHFGGIEDYRQAILDRYEQDSLDAVGRALAAVADLPPRDALTRLPDHFSFDPRLEAAVRGWAFADPAARTAQERVDTARLESLTSLWRDVLPDPDQARVAALVPHLLMIGGSTALPTPSQADMRAAFALLATLVPAVETSVQRT